MSDEKKADKGVPIGAIKMASAEDMKGQPQVQTGSVLPDADKNQGWSEESAGEFRARAISFFDADDQLPLSKHFLLVTITLFFVFFIIWANFSMLDEVTRGEGKIIPSTDVQALQSLDPGIAEEFLVQEGDVVEPGQVLVRLRNIEASSDLEANRVRFLGLQASIARLQAEAENREAVEFPQEVRDQAPQSVAEELNVFRANRVQLQGQTKVLEEQLKQREQELDELTTRINDLQGVIRLQRQERAMIAPLVARGSAPRMELLQLDRALKERQTELNGLKTSEPRILSAIEEAKARLAEVKQAAAAEAQEDLASRLVELNEIRERLSGLQERKVRREIRSPVAGVVQELTMNTVGGVVRAGEDLIKIVPKDDQLIVEARVQPSDRAFIYPGQQAVVKLTAYDFSIYGGLRGELISISADTIEDDQGNSFYRVRLRTYDKELKRKGEILPIIPGMVASVDILTGQKSVMQYLLKPFIKTLDNAMNER